jgi:hypothetical protein
MYRQSDRAPKSPTVIEYSSRWIRPGFMLLGFILLLFGIWALAGLHATHIACSRTADRGACHVRRYGLIRSLQVDLPESEIASLEVTVRTSSKGAKHAEVRLTTTPESGHGVIELETGMWGHVSPARAQEIRSSFIDFKQQRLDAFDAWLSLGPATNIVMTFFALLLGTMGVCLLREQLGQLRPIRVVVDHEREVVIVRRREVPFREIDTVMVEYGRALFWSSRKNEHVPGHRLVLVRRQGADIAVTRAFRAGARSEHEQARRALLHALKRDTA